MADSVGMSPLDHMRTGVTRYLRIHAQGNVIDNLQTVSLGSPSAGNFTLTYKSQTTATIAYNAAASAVQSALEALSTIDVGDVTVTGSAGGPYAVVFGGTLAQDVTAMTGSGAGLTGGTFLITQNQAYHIFQHDMALKFDKPDKWGDVDGVWAIKWPAKIVKDASWGSGTAHKVTLTNLITVL
jgi:hypothetical protein